MLWDHIVGWYVKHLIHIELPVLIDNQLDVEDHVLGDLFHCIEFEELIWDHIVGWYVKHLIHFELLVLLDNQLDVDDHGLGDLFHCIEFEELIWDHTVGWYVKHLIHFELVVLLDNLLDVKESLLKSMQLLVLLHLELLALDCSSPWPDCTTPGGGCHLCPLMVTFKYWINEMVTLNVAPCTTLHECTD